MNGILKLLRPDFSWWRMLDPDGLRNEAVAGFIAAVIIIPQAAALATLAGMPPEYGIYTSILPVVVAALFGSSWHSLSGPNTAVSIMILATVIPLANVGTGYYIALVLALTLLVGMAQLVMAALRVGNVLNLVSHSAISGVTNAVGVLIIVTAGTGFLGVYGVSGEHPVVRVWNLVHDLGRANPYAIAVGIATLAAAIVARRNYRRYSLVIATLVGIAATELINAAVGSATSNIELLGNIPIQLLVVTVPSLQFDDFYVLQQLIVGAVAIGFVGILQCAVIAKTLAEKSGQHVDINKEVVGQGMSNIVAAFASGFAGSASFNRSAAHFSAGTQTPLAAVLSGAFLLAIALLAEGLVARISTPVISAVLIMVGYGLLDFADVRRVCRVRSEAFIFYLVFLAALLVGLTEAVFVGVAASVAVYLSHVSRPAMLTVDSEQGHVVLRIKGNLFFGSADAIKETLITLRERDDARGVLAIDIREAVYMDASAARVLYGEAEYRARRGGKVVLHATRPQVNELEKNDHCVVRAFCVTEAQYAEAGSIVELHPALRPV